MTGAANLVLALLLLQYPYPRQYPGGSSVPQGSNPQTSNTDAVATFNGTFKVADKKFLTIGVDEGQTMRMYITGATKFIRDGKPAKASQFQHDEKITVEAARDARMNLIAVRVEAVGPDKAPEKKSDK